MTLHEKIMVIYPNLNKEDFLYSIILQNDSNGGGDYIARWEHPTLAQPTQEQLDAVDEE